MIDEVLDMAKQEQVQKENEFHVVGALLPLLPSLMVRLGGVLLRFKRDAKKAGRLFKKELLRQHIDEDTAEQLTSMYLESSDLFQYIRYFR